MKKLCFFLITLMILGIFPLSQLPTMAKSSDQQAQETTNEVVPEPDVPEVADIVVGNPKALVTVIEYSSLNCVHCAQFHTKCWPDFKATYLDTKKVKLVYRHFPLNMDSVYLSTILTACIPRQQWFEAILKAYEQQHAWMGKNLLEFGRVFSLPLQKLQDALGDEVVQKSIIAKRFNAEKRLDIPATPAFEIISAQGRDFINKPITYADLKQLIDKHLQKVSPSHSAKS